MWPNYKGWNLKTNLKNSFNFVLSNLLLFLKLRIGKWMQVRWIFSEKNWIWYFNQMSLSFDCAQLCAYKSEKSHLGVLSGISIIFSHNKVHIFDHWDSRSVKPKTKVKGFFLSETFADLSIFNSNDAFKEGQYYKFIGCVGKSFGDAQHLNLGTTKQFWCLSSAVAPEIAQKNKKLIRRKILDLSCNKYKPNDLLDFVGIVGHISNLWNISVIFLTPFLLYM